MTEGSFPLGSAFGKIEISTEGVSKAIAEAQRAFDSGIKGMSASLASFGQQMEAAGLAITKLTAPISLFIGTGVKVAASFEEVLANMGGNGITIENLTIQANSHAEGMAAAKGFEEKLTEIRVRRGL